MGILADMNNHKHSFGQRQQLMITLANVLEGYDIWFFLILTWIISSLLKWADQKYSFFPNTNLSVVTDNFLSIGKEL